MSLASDLWCSRNRRWKKRQTLWIGVRGSTDKCWKWGWGYATATVGNRRHTVVIVHWAEWGEFTPAARVLLKLGSRTGREEGAGSVHTIERRLFRFWVCWWAQPFWSQMRHSESSLLYTQPFLSVEPSFFFSFFYFLSFLISLLLNE